jgi:hypothetical protein
MLLKAIALAGEFTVFSRTITPLTPQMRATVQARIERNLQRGVCLALSQRN